LLIFNNIDLKEINILKNDYNIDIIYKNNYSFVKDVNFLTISYFLNFNLFLNNIVEFYKIIILLNLFNIIKIN